MEDLIEDFNDEGERKLENLIDRKEKSKDHSIFSAPPFNRPPPHPCLANRAQLLDVHSYCAGLRLLCQVQSGGGDDAEQMEDQAFMMGETRRPAIKSDLCMN